MKNANILIVDDEAGIRELLSEILQEEGYRTTTAESVAEAMKIRQNMTPDLVLLDVWLPDGDGISLLKEWVNLSLLTMPVIVMSGHASVDTAVEATKIGALDFLEKPISLQKLLPAIKRAIKTSSKASVTHFSLEKLGNAPCMIQMFERLQNFYQEPTILLSGEVGSSFDIVAEYFQDKRQPWVAPTVEQWLHPSQNWLKAAHGGTLYLGNVALYPIEVQNAIVQVLQTRTPQYKVRVIAACSCPLSQFFTQENFNKTLGELLAVRTVVVPPLRNHLEDLEKNIDTILVYLIETRQIRLVRFTNEAIGVMRQYSWPGNFDQLCQVIKTAALSCQDGVVTEENIQTILERYRARYGNEGGNFDFDLPLRDLKEEVERRYFEYHMRRENNNMSQVAQRVGLERTHLYRKLKQLGIQFSKRTANSDR